MRMGNVNEILYECALSIENDAELNKEMSEWDITLEDGLDNVDPAS